MGRRGLWIWESGSPFTVSSGFATGAGTGATFADYTGSRNIGGISTSPLGPGVYYFNPAEIANFSEPAAGTYGTSGRNTFRGPGFFNVDSSLVKRFAITERRALTFRAEAYNLINKVDFAKPVGYAIRIEGRLRPESAPWSIIRELSSLRCGSISRN